MKNKIKIAIVALLATLGIGVVVPLLVYDDKSPNDSISTDSFVKKISNRGIDGGVGSTDSGFDLDADTEIDTGMDAGPDACAYWEHGNICDGYIGDGRVNNGNISDGLVNKWY